ncbi:MAG: hypothetical protein JXA25_02035 [Anaerolineales bacterium]|nr:hypothetical protein [Anaerolineales bacterium]
MEGEILTPGTPEQGEKKKKTWLIILIVVVIIGLCCCVLPGILYYAGDSILEMIGVDPGNILQGF